MSSTSTGLTVSRLSTALLFAAALGFAPVHLQGGDKDKDKKDEKGTHKSSEQASQPNSQKPPKPAEHQNAQPSSHSSSGGGATHGSDQSSGGSQHGTGTTGSQGLDQQAGQAEADVAQAANGNY